jgi:hypothetical protein
MKKVIIVYFKASNHTEAFSTIRAFTKRFKTYKAQTISNYMSRNKSFYDDNFMRLDKIDVQR